VTPLSDGLRWIRVALLLIAGLGVALVLTAPKDGPARSNLGGNLLAAVVVGAALLAFEESLERRRAAREEAFKQNLHRGLVEAANDSLASLIGAHVESVLELARGIGPWLGG
jgi:hypothetical protein